MASFVEEAHRVTSGITDGTCIQFAPTVPLRRGPAKDIKVPEGFFYPPFGPRFVFKTRTYVGHSNFSVDFNHGAAGANEGMWVLAAAPGTVLIRDFRAPGTNGPEDEGISDVLIGHPGGFRTLYTHMKNISNKVRPGKPVVLGQRLGQISEVGNAEGSHLHHGHFQDGPGFGRPIKMKIDGQAAGCERPRLAHGSRARVQPGTRRSVPRSGVPRHPQGPRPAPVGWDAVALASAQVRRDEGG